MVPVIVADPVCESNRPIGSTSMSTLGGGGASVTLSSRDPPFPSPSDWSSMSRIEYVSPATATNVRAPGPQVTRPKDSGDPTATSTPAG